MFKVAICILLVPISILSICRILQALGLLGEFRGD